MIPWQANPLIYKGSRAMEGACHGATAFFASVLPLGFLASMDVPDRGGTVSIAQINKAQWPCRMAPNL